LLENRKKFEELGCIIPLVKKELYELISDKYSFGELCKKNEILVPEEVKLSGEIVFPIVAKPKKYFSIDKGESLFPIIIKNYMDYEMFYKKCNVEDFYYQKYIRGRSFYLLYYYNRNGEIYKFSQENLVQQPNGKSILAAISSDIHNSEESYKYEVMFKKLDYYGFAMIEIKQNKGKNYMIEANPRFWGPSQLFVDAGINFFEVFLNDYGIIESIPKFENIKDSTRYFWFGGLINTIKNNMNLTYYNISENSFLNYIHIWLKNDIYKRDDTIEIFRKEFLNG
jgi:predicted ATP-grasp superfamily ATP-dependent carboligase